VRIDLDLVTLKSLEVINERDAVPHGESASFDLAQDELA